MKKVLLVTDSIFFKKNFQYYLKKNILNQKLIVKKPNSISSHYFKKNKLRNQLSFCVVNFGLSGGIQYNIKNGNKILEKNIEGYLHVLNCLKEAKIKKIFFISASCVYPKNLKILNTEDFAKKNIEKTSIHYAASKMIGTFFTLLVNKNKNYNWKTIIPATLYGKYNSMDKNNAHVIGALCAKFKKSKKIITLWGSGNAKREFLHILDFIDAIFFIHKNKLKNEIINVGNGKDISIKNLAKIFINLTKFKGRVIWDKKKPEGAKRKLLNSNYLFSLGWKPKIEFNSGISEIIKANK